MRGRSGRSPEGARHGRSQALEFDSTEWIQCTYSGSDWEPEEEAELAEDEDWEESDPWNCIEDHPSLWKSERREGRDRDAE